MRPSEIVDIQRFSVVVPNINPQAAKLLEDRLNEITRAFALAVCKAIGDAIDEQNGVFPRNAHVDPDTPRGPLFPLSKDPLRKPRGDDVTT